MSIATFITSCVMSFAFGALSVVAGVVFYFERKE